MSTCATSVLKMVRTRLRVASAWCVSPSSRASTDSLDLVKDLFEPQLVDLMDDDEEHLVVLGPLGHEMLSSEELLEPEILSVGERHLS